MSVRGLAAAAMLLVMSGQSPPPFPDAVTVLPDVYRLQFENDWVKVTRARYPPHARLPEHGHTTYPAAYVYLNDSGPVVFRHPGAAATVTRPAVTAGSFRVFRDVGREVHEVENTAGTASEFLRVELKTEPRDASAFRARVARGGAAMETAVDRVEFDHAQARISRTGVPARASLALDAPERWPCLVIGLSRGSLREVDVPSGSAVTVSFDVGGQQWSESGCVWRLENQSDAALEILRIELKTRPSQFSKSR